MASGRTIIVGGGIQSAAPFTAGKFPVIIQADPATESDGNIRQDSSTPPKVFVGESGYQANATVIGGAIADAGARRSVVIGDGAIGKGFQAGPDQDQYTHVVIGAGAKNNPTAQSLGNTVIGPNASNTGGSGNVVIGQNASKASVGGANVLIGAGASISVLSNNATVIGASAAMATGGVDVTILGAGASAEQTGVTAIGAGADGRGNSDTVVGAGANTGNNSATARNSILGRSSTISATSTRCLVLGVSSGVLAGHSDSILIGSGQASTASKELRIGNNNATYGVASAALVSVQIGGPPTEAAYPGITYNHVNGTGVDNAVGPLVIVAPRSTGNALPGVIKLQTGVPAAVSGSGLQAARTSLQLEPSAVADETDLLLYDVTAAAVVRVSRGAADSGGVGFRVLRIPN